MMKIKIRVPMYFAEITVLIGEYKEMILVAPNPAKPHMADTYMARTLHNFDGKKNHVVIHSRSAAISVIAHEAVHAASFIFDQIGAKADFNNDEHVAYLVQYICQKVEDKLFK
jgi:hypothetical protein